MIEIVGFCSPVNVCGLVLSHVHAKRDNIIVSYDGDGVSLFVKSTNVFVPMYNISYIVTAKDTQQIDTQAQTQRRGRPPKQ